MTKTAKPIQNVITVSDSQVLPDGVLCVMVPCTDYNAFKQLPRQIEYQGQLLGLTCWNSDIYRAYFRSDCTNVATIVNKKTDQRHSKIANKMAMCLRDLDLYTGEESSITIGAHSLKQIIQNSIDKCRNDVAALCVDPRTERPVF